MSKGCDPLRAYARIQDMIFRNRSYRSSAGGNGGLCVKSAFFLYVPAFFVVEKPSEKHEIRTDGKWKSFTAGLCVVLFLRFSTVRLPGFLPGYSHITCKRQVIHTPFRVGIPQIVEYAFFYPSLISASSSFISRSKLGSFSIIFLHTSMEFITVV